MTSDELKQILTDRQRAYMLAFKTPAGKAVLDDLAVFCRANETCVVPGDRDRTYVLEGRREVFLRIQAHLDLALDDLFQRFTRPAQGAHGHVNDDPSQSE
jgi:phage-related baseplate assembly protein